MTDSSSSLSSLEASVITPTSAIQAGVSVTTTKAQITKLSPSLAEDLYKKESLKQEPHLKIIHLVRHAQGVHNIAGEIDPKGYLLEENEDAFLSPLGEEQCQTLATSSELVSFSQDASLLVVSPMRRTLQTASLSFPHLINKIPWIGFENIREQTGAHPCDRRRPISEHMINFPHVDFSLIADDEDQLYSRYPKEREPLTGVLDRARDFLSFLIQRPEKEIIVVSHSAYLRHLLQHLMEIKGESESEYQNFKNCEMRTFVIDLSLVSSSPSSST